MNALSSELTFSCQIAFSSAVLHHAIKNGIISSAIEFNDLGKIILDPSLGRKNINDITIADLTGTGVQDTAIARHTFSISQEKRLGLQID